MHASVAVFCLAAVLAGGPSEQTIHTDYGTAWKEAQERQLPLLIVLNPGPDSTGSRVEAEMLTRSQHRRDLLANYVVAVIDTSTEKGERVWRQFGSSPLPRVSVIEKKLKLQIHRASAPLVAEDWNLLLEKYRAGLYVAPPAAPVRIAGPVRWGTPVAGPVVFQSAANCFT